MGLTVLKKALYELREYKNHFEHQLEACLEKKKSSSDIALWEVVRYSLLSGGKRIRPIICRLVAESLGRAGSVEHACLCVEFFHTASLIADDMPFMDDDDFRRDQFSSHKKFGQAKALLASYALISWGYEAINHAGIAFGNTSGSDLIGHRSVSTALSRASHLAGIEGAVSGQHLDLFASPKNIEDLREIIYKKTVTLFSLSFELGWIFGGGDLEDLEKVQKVAYHFGLFFQLVDDYQDREQDQDSCNAIHFLGEEKAKEEILFHKNSFLEGIKKLGIDRPEFVFIIEYIEEKSGITL